MAHRNLFFHFACSHRAPRAGSACRHRGMQHGLSRSTHQRQGSHGSGTGTRIHRDSSFPSPRQRRIDIITRGRKPTPPTCSTMPNNSAWAPGNTSSSQSNDTPIKSPTSHEVSYPPMSDELPSIHRTFFCNSSSNLNSYSPSIIISEFCWCDPIIFLECRGEMGRIGKADSIGNLINIYIFVFKKFTGLFKTYVPDEFAWRHADTVLHPPMEMNPAHSQF